jgi:hypothetical protein
LHPDIDVAGEPKMKPAVAEKRNRCDDSPDLQVARGREEEGRGKCERYLSCVSARPPRFEIT